MRSLPFRFALPRSLFLAGLVASLVCDGRADDPSLRADLGGGVVIELVRIEPGGFQQGSPADEPQRGEDETRRDVTISRPFFLGKFPVTHGEFARFTGETRYRTEAEAGASGGFGWDGAKLTQRKDFTWKNPGFPQTDAHPVTIVTYNDARAFLAWLTRKTGRTFSLPTEAQWEYACRAGTRTAFPNGSDPARLDEIAWFRGNAGIGTRPVGQKAANAWGLHDMLGNVWEWCDDWYAPYAPAAATDPVQTQSNLSDKPRRVLRGGSWMKDAAAVRSAARYRNDSASRNADNGFRVMTLDAAPAIPPPRPAAVPPPAVEKPVRVESDRVIPEPPPMPVPREFHYDSGGSMASSPVRKVLPIVAIGILAMIVLKLLSVLRRAISSGGTGVMPGSMGGGGSGAVRTRIVDDGFWIESAVLPAGTVLECRYFAGGRQSQTNVTFSGAAGGQFMFTGSRPSSVAVAVLPGGGPSGRISGSPLGRAAGLMTGMSVSDSTDDEPPSRRRPFPPAY
jgi:formylglycine-generating enzyme required for sulfatase activity